MQAGTGLTGPAYFHVTYFKRIIYKITLIN